jgi:hypothetical protein
MTARASLLCAAALWLIGHAAARAQAQPLCDDLPNPLYLQVGDTQEPLIKALGRELRDEARPISLIYVTSGSCTNVEAIYSGVPITANPKYVPSSEEDAGWKAADPAPSCTIAAEGHAVDVANSALFVSACNPDDPPDGVALFQGPVQGYGFVVPEASKQVAITAEEAYFVFGFGSAGKVTPWDDEAFMFIRPTTKSTLLTLAAAIRVPGSKWRGVQLDKSSEVLSSVSASAQPEKTIGILGVEIYDHNRDAVNVLAYRAYDQARAYYPDSTRTSFDKRNVRDGHYTPWSPTVWLTHVGGDGEPEDADAAYVIDLITGKPAAPAPSFEPLDLVIGVGLVPDCAMQVTRSHEGGDLSLYQPDEPCGCYYESKVGAPSDACVACDDDDACKTGACRHGFCEAR